MPQRLSWLEGVLCVHARLALCSESVKIRTVESLHLTSIQAAKV
jgi:hypothetical protein